MIRKFLLLVALLVSSLQSNALVLTPGTLLGADNIGNNILQYDSAGNNIDTLAIANDNWVGITTVGGSLFGMNVGGSLYSIDLTTGARTSIVNVGGNENLGRVGNNLFTVNFSTGFYNEYTTAGASVQSFLIAAGATGVDGTASNIFSAQYSGANAGGIRVYDSTGTFLNAIALGLPASSISGMSYDAGLDQFWVATGFGDDMIRQYASDGTLLNSFAAQSSWINGLTVVTSAVPEPATLALMGLGLAGIGYRRQRSKIAA
jgi:hypothetical protein